MQVNILAGGPQQVYPEDIFKQTKNWIGVDRGSLFLLHHHIIPCMAIGDFDSMSQSELVEIKGKVSQIIQVNPIKDDTDTELALSKAFTRFDADEVTIYGATGGRLDHFLSNFLMLLKPQFKQYAQQIRIVDRQNSLLFFNPGKHILRRQPNYKYLSFIALGNVEDLTLPDEKYKLNEQSDIYPVAYISNEFISEQATLSFSTGMVAAIYSRDYVK